MNDHQNPYANINFEEEETMTAVIKEEAGYHPEFSNEPMGGDLIENIMLWNQSCAKPVSRDEGIRKFAEMLVTEEYNELIEATSHTERLDALADIVWVVAGYAYSQGYDLVGALQEVQRSNYSKFAVNEDMARADVVRIEREGRYKGVHFEKVYGRFVMKDENEKVLKAECFSEPQLDMFV